MTLFSASFACNRRAFLVGFAAVALLHGGARAVKFLPQRPPSRAPTSFQRKDLWEIPLEGHSPSLAPSSPPAKHKKAKKHKKSHLPSLTDKTPKNGNTKAAFVALQKGPKRRSSTTGNVAFVRPEEKTAKFLKRDKNRFDGTKHPKKAKRKKSAKSDHHSGEPLSTQHNLPQAKTTKRSKGTISSDEKVIAESSVRMRPKGSKKYRRKRRSPSQADDEKAKKSDIADSIHHDAKTKKAKKKRSKKHASTEAIPVNGNDALEISTKECDDALQPTESKKSSARTLVPDADANHLGVDDEASEQAEGEKSNETEKEPIVACSTGLSDDRHGDPIPPSSEVDSIVEEEANKTAQASEVDPVNESNLEKNEQMVESPAQEPVTATEMIEEEKEDEDDDVHRTAAGFEIKNDECDDLIVGGEGDQFQNLTEAIAENTTESISGEMFPLSEDGSPENLSAVDGNEETSHNEETSQESEKVLEVEEKFPEEEEEETDKNPSRLGEDKMEIVAEPVNVASTNDTRTKGNNDGLDPQQDVVSFIEDVLQEDVRSWIDDSSTDSRIENIVNKTRGGYLATEETQNTNGKETISDNSNLVDHGEQESLPIDRESLVTLGDKDSDAVVSVVTWNLAEDSPSEEDAAFIRKFRENGVRPGQGSDLVLISGQECENIKPRRSEGRRSREYRRLMIKMLGKDYVPVALHLLGGIQFGLFAKRSYLKEIEEVSVSDVTCGIGNVFHNKGAIAAFVKVKARNEKDSTTSAKRAKSLKMVFVTAHLAAHVKNAAARDADFWRISSELEVQAPEGFLPRKSSESSNGSFLFDSVDRVFFCGDLNYRLDLPRESTEHSILHGPKDAETGSSTVWIKDLLKHDQLIHSMAEGKAFPSFCEGKISFLPTFKYDKESGSYDTSHKQRIPAWTDRILFQPSKDIRVLEYQSVPEAQSSDHRPVFGSYRIGMEGRVLPTPSLKKRRKQRKPPKDSF